MLIALGLYIYKRNSKETMSEWSA